MLGRIERAVGAPDEILGRLVGAIKRGAEE